MPESISLFGHDVPVYGLCYFAGIFLAAGVALWLCKKRGIERYDMVYASVYTMIAAVLGAKLLFLLVSWRQIVENHVPIMSLLKGGFVFYGGVIGGIFGMWLYCKQFKLPFWDFADVAAVVLPLGHAVGRVGCFAAGCCYGIEYPGPLSHTYTHLQNSSATPIGVPLLPVQLIESGLLLLLFIGLLIGFLRHPNAKTVSVAVYVLSYSVIRFVLEFFRGDAVRGVFLGLSTSQWISVAAAVLTVVWLIVRHKRGQTPADTPEA